MAACIGERRLVGRYALYGQFASGGMAAVHFGRLSGALGFARTVAIKRLHAQFADDPEFAAMFLDEARLASRIHHPNVVGTLDVVSEDAQLYLVMEYVRGESLSRLLNAEPVPPAFAVAIVVDALHGLHAAHEARSATGQPLAIVHRDVSPHNILVGVDGVARIIDFGIAKAVERVHTTRGTDLRGKIVYMPPEMINHERVDRRADVYAAAVVLWEALVRRRFVEVDNDVAAVRAVLERAPEPPGELAPGVPRALDEVVLKGLSKDPSERYATALEMAEALESALAPANKREIGAWVSRVAATSLAARATALEAIEKDEPVEDVPPPLPEEPSRSLPMVEAPSRRVSLSSPEASGPAVVVDAPPEGRRWGWTLATALAAAIVANLAFLGATHIGLRAGPSAGETRAAQAPAGETRAAQAPAGETRAAQAPAQAAAPAGPVPARAMIAVPTPSPVADDPVRVPPRAAHGKASASHPSTKSASCRQPFTLDHGIKVPKLECL